MVHNTLITVQYAVYTVCKCICHTVFEPLFSEEGYSEDGPTLVVLFSTPNQQYGLAAIPVKYDTWKEYIDYVVSNRNCVCKLRLFRDLMFKTRTPQMISMTTVHLTINEEALGMSWIDTETNIKKEYLKIALQIGEKNGY